MGKFCTALRMPKCSFTSVNCAFVTSFRTKFPPSFTIFARECLAIQCHSMSFNAIQCRLASHRNSLIIYDFSRGSALPFNVILCHSMPFLVIRCHPLLSAVIFLLTLPILPKKQKKTAPLAMRSAVLNLSSTVYYC